MFRATVLLALFALFFAVTPEVCHAQYAHFRSGTDTIQVAGIVPLTTQCTLEARVLFTAPSDPGNWNNIYNEWQSSQEDRILSGSQDLIWGYVFPPTYANHVEAPVALDASSFHHVAFTYDGQYARVFLDGVLKTEVAASGGIGTGDNVVSAVGAIQREIFAPSFLGLIDTLRVSNVARYTADFTPPQGDLSSDANTVLLFNFNEPAGTAQLQDLSGNGHTGTLGTGFDGATSPQLGIASRVSMLDVAPSVVTGGGSATGTVTLTSEALSDTLVTLSSSSAKAGVPSSVTVPAGQTTANFTVTASSVSTITPATISAGLNGFTKTADIAIIPAGLLSLTLNTSSVLGGKTVKGTVRLTHLAPSGGYLVSLQSLNPAASVPAGVTVPAGSKTATFIITTSLPDTARTGDIRASFGGTTKSATLTVLSLVPTSITLSSNVVFGGKSVTATVKLNGVAPAGGKSVSIGNTNAAATCPASVLVPAGKSSVTFTIPTSNPPTQQTGEVSATLGDVTVSAPLTVNHAITTKLVVSFLPLAKNYPRGTVITLQAVLKDGSGNPVAGKSVRLVQYVQSQGVHTALGTFTTDSGGKVQLPGYTVPTDPSMDYVYIEAYFDGEGDYVPSKGSKRIPIGP